MALIGKFSIAHIMSLVQEGTMTIDVTDLIRKTDLLALVELAGGKLEKSGGNWTCACPIHGGTNPSGFHIYPAKDGLRWKCFTDQCGGGDSIAFVMAWQKLDFVRACQYLRGDTGIDAEAMLATNAQRAEWLIHELEGKVALATETIRQLREAQRWVIYSDRLRDNDEIVRLWERSGIPREWQSIWQLGYNPEFRYWIRQLKQEHVSPSMTIPLFSSGWECSNIRHRILQPVDSKDKYRPEYSGIPAEPFVADPDLAKGEGRKLLILEGEKKAMVTYLTLDEPGSQAIGIPGKCWFRDGAIKAFGANIDEIYVCLDPDAVAESEAIAEQFGGRARIIDLPYKIDDLIVSCRLGKNDMQNLLKTARYGD